MKHLLIIGGTGTAGRLIANYFETNSFPVKIDIAARGITNPNTSNGIIKLDANKPEKLKGKLSNYDLVILAIGPFEKFGARIHEICLQEKVDCIDINDDPDACQSIFKLANHSLHSSVYTGMGLSPGLSTLLLKVVVSKLNDQTHRAGIRLYFGAAVQSGKASIYTMFSNIRKQVALKKNNKTVYASGKKMDLSEQYTFNEALNKLPLVFYSSPEVFTSQKCPLLKNIDQIDFAFHLQNCPPSLVRFLRGIKWFRKSIVQWLTNTVYKNQTKLSEEPGNNQLVIAQAFAENETHRVSASLSHSSSFDLTAMFCFIIAKKVLNKEIDNKPGIYSFDHLDIDFTNLMDNLNDLGLHINVDVIKKSDKNI
ncbi:hypothetical protein DMA11_11730 [Marinilabiliaceae bacterium JC017]|nr:hypothetical protein DMA11_11730 [Marinilabiliaceae bacterium JC017]